MFDMKTLTNPQATRERREFFTAMWNLLPNPNLLFANGPGKRVTFDNIRNDPHIFSCIQSRKAGAKAKLWEIQIDKSREDVYQFVTEVFSKLKMNTLLEEILDAPLNGYQPLEIDWQFDPDTKKVVPNAIQGKPFDWFVFDAKNVLKLQLLDNIQGEELDPFKFLLAQHGATYANPYGEAILSKCLWYIAFKQGGLNFWLRFIEKFGMPHYVLYTDGDKDEADTSLEGLIQDASIVLNETDRLELVNFSTNVNVNVYKEFLDFLEKNCTQALLSATLTQDVGKTGSFAASKTHFQVRDEVVQADMEIVIEVMKTFIGYLVEINFGKKVLLPKFIVYDKTDVDKETAEVVKLISDTGYVKFTKEFFMGRFGFSEDEFEIIEAPAQPIAKPASPTEPAPKFAEGKKKFDIEDKIQSSVDDALLNASSVDKGIMKFLESQKDYSSALKNIAKLIPTIDDKVLQHKLTNDLFFSQVAGELTAKDEADGLH